MKTKGPLPFDKAYAGKTNFTEHDAVHLLLTQPRTNLLTTETMTA